MSGAPSHGALRQGKEGWAGWLDSCPELSGWGFGLQDTEDTETRELACLSFWGPEALGGSDKLDRGHDGEWGRGWGHWGGGGKAS